MVNLTPEQIQIVQAPLEISICVNSVPGSGKTTTMVHRIHYLANHYQVPLNQIAMFTYNHSLGKDMSIKLQKLGIESSSMAWCGTLHAFCYRHTRNYQDLRVWIDDPPEISSELKYIIFDEYQD